MVASLTQGRILFAIATVVLALLPGCGRKTKPEIGKSGEGPIRISPAASGERPVDVPVKAVPLEKVPSDATVEEVSGQEVLDRIRRSPAKGTLVNAWASWCGPCQREFPMLMALRDSLSSQKVDVLFVSVDEPESHGAAVDFATTRGLSAPLLVAQRPLGPFKQAMSPKWPGMLPATFLFDEAGKLRYFWPGPVYEEEILPIIEGFLAGAEIDGVAKVPLQRGKDFRMQ